MYDVTYIAVMYMILVNFHALFEHTEKLALDVEFCLPDCRDKYVYFKVSSKATCLRMGYSLLPNSVLWRRVLNSPRVKILCPRGAARRQSRSTRWYYCLPYSIKVSAGGKQSRKQGKLRHGEKAWLGTPADCLNFPSQFLLDAQRGRFWSYYLRFSLGRVLFCLGLSIWNSSWLP